MGHPPLEAYAGRGHFSEGEQGVPQRNMGREEEVRGLLALGQVEALLHQLAQRLELPPQGIERAEPLQHQEEPGSLSNLLQITRAPACIPVRLLAPKTP